MNSPRQEAPVRNFDKLEERYNREAEHNWSEERRKKNLYYRIVQLEQSNLQERRKMEKELKGREDHKIKEIWQAQQDRYRDQQRRKREQVDDVRKVNQSMSLDLMNASKVREDYIPHNDYPEYYLNQMHKQKKQQEQFLKNAEEYGQFKKQLEKHQKSLQREVEIKKQQEQKQQQYKRDADLRRIREKHQQNFAAYHNLEEHLKNKQREEEMLEQYIVNQGESDQQARLLAKRVQFEARQKDKRDRFIRDLKGQLDSHSYLTAMEKKLEIEHERNLIDQRNRYFSEMDRISRLRKSQENHQILETLKGQVKPRKLLADPEKPELVGSGSPVNIGKVMGDDRKRQLDWIEKSLLREIHY